MPFYFVRHGESEANIQKIISNRGFVHGLTQRGIEQANDLATQLKPIAVKHIYTSPLKRAVQTAEILGKHDDIKFTIVDALREFDCGTLEGRSDAESWEALYAMWDDWILRGNWSKQFEGGDSFEDMQARFLPFFKSVMEQFREKHEAFILVGHGGTFRAMLPLLLENIDFSFAHKNWLPNAGYVRAEFRKAVLVCTHWGDIICQ